MLIIVLAAVAACGAAVFCVLDRPVARDKSHNTVSSSVLLTVSAAGLLAGLVYGISGLLTS
jgi:hypothetical protein